NWDIKPIYDVIARIPGSVFPDEWIIRGNHHDAWVNGAEDPTSGQVALLEEARGLAELLKQGWKPKRTVIYCAWDGEEEGLLGSTEWAEEHADELETKGAVYINSDSNGRGYLGMEGSHTLQTFINGVARDIQDPEKNFSDSDFTYGRALAQTIGTAVLRLSDADILPYDFTALSDTLHRYAEELKDLLKNSQDQIRERNREIREGVFTATGDPRKTYVPP